MAVRDAVEAAPTSIRKLAAAAGVPHVTLVKIRLGELGASPEVARRVLSALREWSEAVDVHAAQIEQALDAPHLRKEDRDG